jgi:hypothetical protein
MSIHVYVLLCIENEEEVIIEEETGPQAETDPEAPTIQGKPQCIYPSLLFQTLYHLK